MALDKPVGIDVGAVAQTTQQPEMVPGAKRPLESAFHFECQCGVKCTDKLDAGFHDLICTSPAWKCTACSKPLLITEEDWTECLYRCWGRQTVAKKANSGGGKGSHLIRHHQLQLEVTDDDDDGDTWVVAGTRCLLNLFLGAPPDTERDWPNLSEHLSWRDQSEMRAKVNQRRDYFYNKMITLGKKSLPFYTFKPVTESGSLMAGWLPFENDGLDKSAILHVTPLPHWSTGRKQWIKDNKTVGERTVKNSLLNEFWVMLNSKCDECNETNDTRGKCSADRVAGNNWNKSVILRHIPWAEIESMAPP